MGNRSLRLVVVYGFGVVTFSAISLFTAIKKLLRGELDHSSLSLVVSGLSGGESPARSALTLVKYGELTYIVSSQQKFG
jgi:hypothetical protein